jgi:hypothetical protein
MTESRIVQGIVGGVAISTRVLEDAVLIEDLWDTYARFPGASTAIDLKSKATFHNGFTEEVDNEHRLILLQNDIYTELFGYSVILFENGNIQTVNPRVNRVGFIFTEFDDLGEPMKIAIRWNPDEQFVGPDIYVDRAPFSIDGTGDFNGFYPFRTLRGLPGCRGISSLLPLIDVIRAQHKIYIEYTKYAEHQGLAHPVVKIENLTDPARTQVRAQLTAPRKDKAVIIDMKDDFYYESPQQGAYDPSFMMEFADKYIARQTSINMFQLTGDPMGYLSASETNINEWFSAIKANQDHKLPQYLPILMALGCSEDVTFQDPSEPTMESQMEAVKLFREATDGLVSREAQLQYINNEILGLEGEDELEIADDEEYDKFIGRSDDKNGTDKQEPDSNEP